MSTRRMPKPCRDCGAAIPWTGRRPAMRCDTCRVARARAKGAENMRSYRAAGYKPPRRPRTWDQRQRDRFWARVDRSDADGCWRWTGPRLESGYGTFGTLGWTVLAHRASWEIANGPIPEGIVIRHTCDNPPCVRPDHLLSGTQADNIADVVERGHFQHGDDHWTNRTKRERGPDGRWMSDTGSSVSRAPESASTSTMRPGV